MPSRGAEGLRCECVAYRCVETDTRLAFVRVEGGYWRSSSHLSHSAAKNEGAMRVQSCMFSKHHVCNTLVQVVIA